MTIIPRTYRASAVTRLPTTIFVEGGASFGHPVFRYPLIRSAEPFDRVILSPNGRIDEAGVIDFKAGDPAQGLHHLVSWAGPRAVLDAAQPFPPPVDADVLKLAEPVRELTIHSQLSSIDPEAEIARLGITLYHAETGSPARTTVAVTEMAGFAPVQLPVGFLSQFAVGTPNDDSLCCPTSAAMVLRFWGIGVEVEEFARLSYDRRHRIYGNWSLTAAVLSSLGMKAWIEKHRSLSELYAVVQSGRPVIVSVSFGAGELPNAPVPASRGHLMVVRGFDENGDVLVCDPAGRTAETGQLTYDYRSFARAWLGHGGIAIHAVPGEKIT